MAIGVIIFAAAWLAWKVLHTKSRIPAQAPPRQNEQR